jgi:ABC-type multidrug transport system fused ATPase/permease subunit
MENGEILESGTYDELLTKSNKFASLVKSEKVEKN